MSQDRPRIVLVHGASHGAWCWKLVIPLLIAAGCDVEALDLPGLGNDSQDPRSVSFVDYVDRIIEILRGDNRKALLVGHSMGGGPISRAAEEAPERITGLVYVAAMLPLPGETMLTSFQGEAGAKAPPMHETDQPGLFEFDPSDAHDLFYARCDPTIAQNAVDRLRPQPMGPSIEPINLTAERWGRISKSYIICLDDRILAPETQRWLCGRVDDIKQYQLDTDHSPFFSDPEGLANILIGEARLPS